ncbi:MAG: acetoacetate decarboxylase family protein, partial [Actinobacteria bacterium]|nr:acetoacetate decarboxylase family protein [Actinomycetota bacterium]
MAELKGFMPPRSPEGRASIVPPPPWHYSGDVLTIEYRTDPAGVADLLPDPLEP